MATRLKVVKAIVVLAAVGRVVDGAVGLLFAANSSAPNRAHSAWSFSGAMQRSSACAPKIQMAAAAPRITHRAKSRSPSRRGAEQ